MKQVKSPIGGRQVTKKEALKGLGDPTTWEKESAALYAQFQARPRIAKLYKSPFQSVKEKVENLTTKIGLRKKPETAYAQSAGVKARPQRTASAKAKKRRSQKKKRKP